MANTNKDSALSKEHLVQIFDNLNNEGQNRLLEYAEFLAEKHATAQIPAAPKLPPEPIPSAAPENESVPAAIKRLSRSYPMLDKVKLMNPTANLMTQHLTQGRSAQEVIRELETLFQDEYNLFLEKFHEQEQGNHTNNAS